MNILLETDLFPSWHPATWIIWLFCVWTLPLTYSSVFFSIWDLLQFFFMKSFPVGYRSHTVCYRRCYHMECDTFPKFLLNLIEGILDLFSHISLRGSNRESELLNSQALFLFSGIPPPLGIPVEIISHCHTIIHSRIIKSPQIQMIVFYDWIF